MGEGGGRRWFGPSTWCLAAGGALTALYYLSPGGRSRSVVVAAGDRVLVEVGDRLRTCLRSTDTLARMGGDEFAMLLVDAGVQEATRVADRIFERLGASFLVKGNELFVDASIGIAEFPDG